MTGFLNAVLLRSCLEKFLEIIIVNASIRLSRLKSSNRGKAENLLPS